MADIRTPRVDAVVKEWPRESFGAMAELARQLERELAAAEQRAKAEYQRGREDERKECAGDVISLCLRLCMEPSDTHAPETLAVLNKWRASWEAAASGVPISEAIEARGKE